MKNNRLIVVLGMHRSGTSAITRGLQALGVELGDRLMPPVEYDNAKGYWEDVDLNALNIEILSVLGSDWHHLAPIKPGDVEILRNKGYFLRAVELLRQKTSDTPTFGFKDPRVAKLLPFWKEVFCHCQVDVSYVLAVRHPLSVAKSLAKRDGFDLEKGYLLWQGHVLASLSNTEGIKRVLVDYDRLMQAPGRELSRIANALDLEINSAELKTYSAEFLDTSLRHTCYDLADFLLNDACPPLVRETYATLLDVAADRLQIENPALQQQVARWENEFDRIRSTMHWADRILADRDSQLVSLKVQHDVQIANLNQVVSDRDGQIASLIQQITSLGQTIDALRHSTSWRVTAPLRWVVNQIKRSKHVVLIRD